MISLLTTCKELLLSRRKDIVQIIKYGISGVTGACIQFGTFFILVEIFDLWYLHGVVLAFIVSLIITFLLQKFWTFQDRSTARLKPQLLKYILIALCALILNVGLMYVLVDIFDLWHVASQACVVLFGGALTFLMNRMFTFTKTEEERERENLTCPF